MNLDEIRARAAAATPAPWRWAGNMDNSDPRLTGNGGEVFGHIDRDRHRDDAECKRFASYLREQSISDGNGGWRSYTDAEVEQRVTDEWLEDDYGNPATDSRLAFYGDPGPFYHCARDLAVYSVAPDATRRNDKRVYRADIVGLRNPNAIFIAAARQDVDDLLAEVDRLNALLAERYAPPTIATMLVEAERIIVGGKP